MQAESVGGDAAHRAASPSPRLPVQALALPEFTTTPRSRSHDDEPRVRRTGAAAAAFVVNSTADEHGSVGARALPSRACRSF